MEKSMKIVEQLSDPEQKEIIYFIINHFQINKLKDIVHNIDETAFISLQDVSDIIKRPKD